ncbi:MAG: ribokinase-like domain-containing protein [bacterium]|nr:MAG: ribokinase-like domain-containing protein [bacterium]
MERNFSFALPENRPFDVVGLGLNAVDHIITVPHYPEFNTKIRLLSHSQQPGGQVASALTALARLGCKTRYIGKVGDDQAGQLQLSRLKAEGIEHTYTKCVSQATNQIAFIIIDSKTGERTIIWDRDERLAIQAEEVEEAAICAGKILHIDGHDVEADISAAQFAHKANMAVVIDVDNFYPGADKLLPHIDFLVTSSDFPGRVTGISDYKAALAKLKEISGSYFVAMTLGKEGVLAYHEGEYLTVRGFEIDCSDTTGAGDAFHGGFIYGLLQSMTIKETLRFANAVAAMKCQKLGAQTGLPSLAEVNKFLSERI